MNRILTICMLVALVVFTAGAQQRIPCVRQGEASTRTRSHLLPEFMTDWDASRIYRQPVVLISFKDCDFMAADPVAYYNQLLNEPGYNEGVGKGCVADYFREQSGGLCNIEFDIYGPVKIDTTAAMGNTNYGDYSMKKALEILRTTTDVDFSIYDWNGDGKVNQMVFIAAGYTGNQAKGYIWPNTSRSSYKAPGNLSISMNSISCELWEEGLSCGIGTICHEFSHCLGLPDIYPTLGGGFSIVDEWDLMDGGNFTNRGWCPPNYSSMEKMLLGWSTPTELKSVSQISDVAPVSEGGETFIIRNPDYEDEFYLLENRRQSGWDYGIPGNGMLIFHIDYDHDLWADNYVNIQKDELGYDIFHADNKTYKDWDPSSKGGDDSKYTMPDKLRNIFLSTTAYPYTDDSLMIHASLTDATVPAATLLHEKSDGSKLMGKPIMNISIADDGSASFDFSPETVSFRSQKVSISQTIGWYDMHGQQLPAPPATPGIYIVRYSDGTTRKLLR